jgi:hypothetical protein
MSWSFSCALLRVAGSQLAAGTAVIAYLLDVCTHPDIMAVGTLLLAWLLAKGIGIVVFFALMVLGSEVVLL